MLIDSHLHIYREREIGVRAKADYPIVEYGTLAGVEYSARGGDAADALAALAEAGVSYAAVLNVFLMDGMPQPASGLVWPGADGPPPHADRAADLHPAEEAHPLTPGDLLVDARDRLDLRMVGRDARPHEPERRRQAVEQVDREAGVEQRGGGVEAGRPGADDDRARRRALSHDSRRSRG